MSKNPTITAKRIEAVEQALKLLGDDPATILLAIKRLDHMYWIPGTAEPCAKPKRRRS